MILVTGATGKVGSEAVRLLRQRGLPVRAMVRDPGKAMPLAAAGAELAEADFDDSGSIDRALANIDTVILVSPGVPAQELSVVAGAVRQGVKHLVKVTSNAAPDSPIARRRAQAEIEAGLAASGLPHTLLRANAFMQNTLALAPAIKKTGGFGSSAGAGQVGMVDSRDVGAAAAEIAAAPAAHAGRTYRLTGPALITYADVATVLSGVLGRPVAYHPVSFEADRMAMIRAGVPEPVAQMNAQAFSLIAEGDAAWLSPDIASLLGRPARSFAQFAAAYASAFR